VHAEVIACSERSGLEETLQGPVQDRRGKLEELLKSRVDKYDVELAERTARGAFATEVPEMLESKWRLQGQLQERTLERNMAVLATEFEQRQAKLAGEMQEFAAAMQKALEVHMTSVEERFCTEKEANEILNEAQKRDILSIKTSHDSQVMEVQSIMDFLAYETDARQQQHMELEAARHQLQGHITRIVEDCGALREVKAPAPVEACALDFTGQHCMEVQQELVQPAVYANAEECGRAARQDDAARTAEVAHPWTPSAHVWVKQRPGGWASAAASAAQVPQLPTVGARPYTPRCSSLTDIAELPRVLQGQHPCLQILPRTPLVPGRRSCSSSNSSSSSSSLLHSCSKLTPSCRNSCPQLSAPSPVLSPVLSKRKCRF